MTATTTINCLAPRLHTTPGAAEFADRLTAAMAARGLTLESFGGNYPWDDQIPARDAWDAEIIDMLDAAEEEWAKATA
jgi:hypothetical protein